MKVPVGFTIGDNVTYDSGKEKISATIVTVHSEPNAPAGYEYTIRITGRSKVYRRGMEFRTDGLTLKLRNRPKPKTDSDKAREDKRKQERQDMLALKSIADRIKR